MFQLLRGIALIAALMTANCGFAFSQSTNSANFMMSACRDWLNKQNRPTLTEAMSGGMCLGVIAGISYLASGVCAPAGVTVGQEIRVVVKYIDDRPEKLNENFKALVLEALRTAWPCGK